MPRAHLVVAGVIGIAAIGCDVGLTLSGHASPAVVAVVNTTTPTLIASVLGNGKSTIAASKASAAADAAQRTDVTMTAVARKVFNGGLDNALREAMETPTDLVGRVALVDASSGSTTDASTMSASRRVDQLVAGGIDRATAERAIAVQEGKAR